MGKEIVNQVQKNRVPGRINPRKNTPRHIVTKLTKIKHKDKIIKTTREKWQIIYKVSAIRLSADFSTKNLQARKECHNIFKVVKWKSLQPRILYPARLQIWWRNQRLSRQTKVKRIQHCQISVIANTKGTSVGRKHKARKRSTENKLKTIKKMVIGFKWAVMVKYNWLIWWSFTFI